MKKLLRDESEETLDTIFSGQLKILQKKKGYRFSIDALLLAHFAEFHPTDQIIDLGTGCGIIPLILAFRRQAKKMTGVEIQPSLADLARRNVELNRLAPHIQIWEKDLKNLALKKKDEPFDVALSNPPYRKVGSGRINPNSEKALARHEMKATLSDVLRAAYHLLKDKGRLAMIYPASQAVDLIQGMRQFHLEPKRLRFVHSHQNDDACLLLAEAIKEGNAQVQVVAPLFLYALKGVYTKEAQSFFL
jgi:tRNA1Val (adenine37-N6)-methyltransferase